MTDGRAKFRSSSPMGRFGPVVRFDEIDSTNTWLAGEARSGDATLGTVAIAAFQTAGRGRLGRSWTAPTGSALMMSVLIRPRWTREHWGLVTMALGVAVVETARDLGAPAVTLKWPNDAVVDAPGTELGYRKLSGVLAESTETPTGPAAVVGVGINTTRPAVVPAEIADRAVWLDDLGVIVALDDLAGRVLECFGLLLDEAPEAALDRVRARCSTLGRSITVNGVEPIEGQAVDIGADGSLTLVDAAGTRHRVVTGDVTQPGLASRAHLTS